MTLFEPFKDEAASLTLDELTVENRLDRIEIYGNLKLTRDKAGLELARQLKSLLDTVVATLETEDLPEQVASSPTDRIANPFD